MTGPRYRRNAGCVYTLKYHLVWCSKYWRKVLTGKITDDLHNLLRKKAEDLEVTIEALEIMPDHVHFYVSADPTDASQRLVNQFKCFASQILRQNIPLVEIPPAQSLEPKLFHRFGRACFRKKQSSTTSKIRRGLKR